MDVSCPDGSLKRHAHGIGDDMRREGVIVRLDWQCGRWYLGATGMQSLYVICEIPHSLQTEAILLCHR